MSQLVHPDLPNKGANYVKSIANSAIEIARIKSLEDGVAPGVFSIVRIDFYYHVKIESNVPGQTTIFRCHPKWNNDSKAGISGREWFDWVEVNWEKGDESSCFLHSSCKTSSLGKCYFLQHNNHSLSVYSFLEKFN